MLSKLTCPVCDRKDVEDNTCPNCDADLTLMRILAELPPSSPSYFPSLLTTEQPGGAKWLPYALAGLILVLGIILGTIANNWFSQSSSISRNSNPSNQVSQQPESSSKPTPTITSSPLTNEPTSNSEGQNYVIKDGGFQYTVRPGDTKSLLAKRFYGDKDLWPLIIKANPSFQEHVDLIEIGDVLFIPNIEKVSTAN
ncbi:MAG TPA: LysM peptidoglycan-binding domain-containing protein [Candidatus Sericytochromatia bacterium]